MSCSSRQHAQVFQPIPKRGWARHCLEHSGSIEILGHTVCSTFISWSVSGLGGSGGGGGGGVAKRLNTEYMWP